MEKDEERPDAEVEDESAGREEASGPPISAGPSSGSTPQGRQEGPGGNVRAVVISAGAVVVGVVLFVAGFLTHSLLDDDLDPVEEDLATLTGQVGEIQDALGIAVGDGTVPTPAPVVAVTADDDPFVGPDDAPVTIIEFTDYQ